MALRNPFVNIIRTIAQAVQCQVSGNGARCLHVTTADGKPLSGTFPPPTRRGAAGREQRVQNERLHDGRRLKRGVRLRSSSYAVMGLRFQLRPHEQASLKTALGEGGLPGRSSKRSFERSLARREGLDRGENQRPVAVAEMEGWAVDCVRPPAGSDETRRRFDTPKRARQGREAPQRDHVGRAFTALNR
jgi:hypothetical protein